MNAPRIALALLVLTPLTAAGQNVVAGRVVRVEAGDTLPVPHISVVLHRVGSRVQGPVDTVRAGPAGRFRFRFSADTGVAYLLSSRYGGIEYFSQPVATNPEQPDTAVVMIVADTSSIAPVQVRQRTLLISRADESGTRTVLDWFVLGNAGEETRVAPDPVHPAWGTPLPAEAQAVELADNRLSQFSPDALVFRRDSALIFAPLSPGDKELMLQYRIPGTLRRFLVPSDRISDSVFVLLEESGARVATPGFTQADTQMLDGRAFQRWAGTLPQPAELEIALPSARLSQGQLLAALVLAVGSAFVLLTWVVVRRRRGGVPDPRLLAPDPAALTDQIARLDERFEGREAEIPATEWTAYRAERARLVSELSRALAPRRSRS
jgi:hypothetical protein